MKDVKHFSKVKRKAFTFMIIPNTTGKVVTFRLPYWLLLTIIISSAVILMTACSFYGTFIKTSHELHDSRKKVVLLSEENNQQANEIKFYQNRTLEIEQKLAVLDELENEVLNMVGLAPKKRSGDNEPVFMVSRSMQLSPLDIRQDEYQEEIKQLDILVEQQEYNMQQLIEKVEKQIDYLDSLPNIMPAYGNISSPYGYRTSPYNSRKKEFHQGIDISNRSGTNINAAGSGIVTFSGYNGAYGLMVIISHGNGYNSIYAHNSKNLVKEGAEVKKGDLIAKMGSTGRSTGPHVHFEIRLNGNHTDPKTVPEK